MSKLKGQHRMHKGPAATPPAHPQKIVDRKPLKVPVTRHPATGGRRRHA